MEAKRGPSSGEKAGNANVVPSTPVTESSSSTKKNSTVRATTREATTPDAAQDTKTSLFFEHSDDSKSIANKVDRSNLFLQEHAVNREDAEKPSETSDQAQSVEEHEEAQTPLTNEQELQVVEDYTKDRLEVVDAELAAAEKNSADAVIAQADKVLLEHIAQAVHERTSGQAATSDEILDVASVKAEEALHMTHEVSGEESPHEMTEAERDDLIDSILHGPAEPEDTVETYSLDEEVVSDEPAAMPAAGSASGAGGPPPSGPVGGEGAADDPDPARYNHAGGDTSVASAGTLVAVPAPRPSVSRSETPVVQNEAQRRRDFNNGLLIGGVLGYVVGRNHGRKKAERAIKPELARHKKEVDALQQKIIAREQHIRSLAANRVIAQQVETHTRLDSQKQEFGKATLTSKETPDTPNPKLSAELVGAAATAIGRPTAAEAAAPAVVLAAARAHNPAIEKTPVHVDAVAEVPAAVPVLERTRIEPSPALSSKDVKQLPQAELENVAQTISIKGQTLRKMYESGHIDTQSLRHIVTEYVRSGKVDRLVQTEVAATQFRKRSPELIKGSSGAAIQAVAIAQSDTPAQPQAAHMHTSYTSISLNGQKTNDPVHSSAEKTLNGRVVIAAAVVVAVAIILFATRSL